MQTARVLKKNDETGIGGKSKSEKLENGYNTTVSSIALEAQPTIRT